MRKKKAVRLDFQIDEKFVSNFDILDFLFFSKIEY